MLEARHTYQPPVRRSNVHTPDPPARVDGRAPPQRLRPPNGRAPCLLNVIPPNIQANAITAGRRSKTLGIDLKRIADYHHRPHVESQRVNATAIQKNPVPTRSTQNGDPRRRQRLPTRPKPPPTWRGTSVPLSTHHRTQAWRTVANPAVRVLVIGAGARS